MTETSNFKLPIYGNNDVPKWTDTNEPFQDLDGKVADKTANNSFTGTNTFGEQVTHNADLLMKGGSTIESDDGVITPTAPSSDKTGTDVIQINNSTSNPLYKIRPIQHSNGKVDLDIAGESATNGGALTFNGVSIITQVYSTLEQIVGTWIDGRPIYRKIVELNNPTIRTEVHLVDNANDLIDVKLVTKRTLTDDEEQDTNFYNNSNDFLLQLKGINKTGHYIWYYYNSPGGDYATIRHLRAVIEYTKTTDAPTN